MRVRVPTATLLKAGLVSVILQPGCCSFLPCDPGWHYRVAKAAPVHDDGLRYVLPGPGRTRIRVYASLFTSSLTTEFEVTNEATEVLTITPDELRAYDSQGTSLPRSAHATTARCQGRPREAAVPIGRGETCKISVDWQVRPDPNILRSVRLVHSGIARGSNFLRVDVQLEMDD